MLKGSKEVLTSLFVTKYIFIQRKEIFLTLNDCKVVAKWKITNIFLYGVYFDHKWGTGLAVI